MKNKIFKRMSAAFVAICIAVSLMPAVFAEVEGTKTYYFSASAAGVASGGGVDGVKNFGNHGWYFKDIDNNALSEANGNHRIMQLNANDLLMKRSDNNSPTYTLTKPIKIAFILKAPENVGFYRVESKGRFSVQLYLNKYDGGVVDVDNYLEDPIKSGASKFYSQTGHVGNTTKDYVDLSMVKTDGIVYSNGISDLLFVIDTLNIDKNRYFKELNLVPINPAISLAVDDPVLEVGETAKATVNATWIEGTTTTTQKMLNSFVDYELSADPSITIDELGNIKAIKTGPTTITVTYGEDTYEATVNVVKPTVLPEEEAIADTTVNFKASAYEGGSVSDAAVQEVTIGTDVTVTATPNAGYTFAYWKNAAGVVLSTSATETFKVNTNMGVIAVFDKIPTDDAIPVYFYNGNGLPLGNASVAKNTTFGAAKTAANVPAKPTLTGFEFSHWSDKNANVAIEDTDLITALTRAVAIYEDANTTFTVKNGETTIASNVKYGESVTVNGSENFSCWKLGDKVVSYEKDYTFDVYGNITLTEVTGEAMTKAPVLVLDKVDGNYFLTYDEGDYELIEAGILFGDGNVNIGSTNGYKAAAKRYTGQFTAQPHEGATSATKARGYLICKSGDEYKVLYADLD